MLIYILHSDRIYTFRLPKEATGNYILTDNDSDGHIRNLTNISAIDGKWYINSNDDIKVNYNGKQYDQIQIVEYNFYSINLYKKENIILYICPGNENNIIVKEARQDTNIIIGKESSCDITYLSNNVFPKQIELEYTNKRWSYKNLNPTIPVYVNKKNVKQAILNDFDTIFMMGLKILLIANKIFIISPPGLLQVISQKLNDPELNYNVANFETEENIKDFYSSTDYFSKSPVFTKKYDEYRITITSPEEKHKNDSASFLFQIIPSALMSITSLVSAYFSIQSYKSGESDKEAYITSVMMCVIMLIVGIIWPVIEALASKIRTIIFNRLRTYNYKKYLKRKHDELAKVLATEKATLEFNNLSLSACQEAIEKRYAYLFSKNIDSSSFLTLRFGIGRILSAIKFEYTKPDLIVENDKLLNKVDELMNEFKYIDNAPFTISLKDITSLALINSNSDYGRYLKALILQLITLHDYKSLKLVIFTNELSSLMKIRNLNHCWNDDRSFRYFASNLTDAENVSSELVRIFNNYSETKNDTNSQEQNIKTHYLIITDSIEYYRNLKIIDDVIHSKGAKGFSIIMFSSKIVNIPTGCRAFIDYNDKEASYFQSEMDEKSIIKFTPEMLGDDIDFSNCIDLISNIPIKIENDVKGSLPDKLGFLEMYNVGKLEQLNIINRWKTSQVVNSLSAPIGVDSNGNILSLDLHESKHGPHGLIAGMTGSGKSEFIVTYILSLAINYSPDEVQFVLIDYKGGGLAGAFENRKTGVKLPHLVGTITNLDKSEMNRTLVSIKSELQRRQKKFNEAKELLNTGSIDIYKYQSLVREGTLKESMSHLFIVCDEFAELKAQQPDFMDELVSAARIGRSLGIHLILATQKPSGVVDDQIWSNSKFKVCCKVQTADDSSEMIRKPDAAYIKESGRFYLQVGYDEYFVMGQSAYSGVQYIPSEKVISKLDDTVMFINDIGDSYKAAINKEDVTQRQTSKKYGEELNNVLKYIVDIANANNYKYHQLWLDNVPKMLLYGNLVKKYSDYKVKPFNIEPLIGEYDNPKNQSQGYVSLPLTTGGNTMIIGSTGMGKTTLLSTMIYSSIINHTEKELNFYIVDLGSEKLRKYYRAPQVGDVLGINDTQKINYLFHMIDAEISKRQKYYSKNGGDFAADVRKGSSVFPNIIVIIHGIEVFRETFSVLYDETLGSITRSCFKYGIDFVVTSTTTSGLSYALENNFPQTIMLNVNDPSEYEGYFSEKMVPSKNPGRGLLNIESGCVEFQTALSFEEEKEQDAINFVIDKLLQLFPNKAPEVPIVPKHLHFSSIKQLITDLYNVPIGVNTVTAQYEYFDYSRPISLLSASNSENLERFISNYINTLSLCDNNKVIVLNGLGADSLEIKTDDRIKIYDANFKKVFPILKTNIEKLNNSVSDKTFTIVVLGYHGLNNHMLELKKEDDDIITLDELILSVNNANFKFILYENTQYFKNIINGNLAELVDNQSGIWIGADYEDQESFDMERVYSESQLPNDCLVIIDDSTPKFVKYPTVK